MPMVRSLVRGLTERELFRGLGGILSSGVTPSAVLLIHDTFGAIANGVDLNGTTPDTVNTPGGTWIDIGTIQGDGAGGADIDVNNSSGIIDAGIANNRMAAEIMAQSVGAIAHTRVAILCDTSYTANGGNSIQIDHRVDIIEIEQIIAGSITVLATNAAIPTRSVGVIYPWRIEFDGADIVAYFDDVERARVDSYAVPAGLNGNTRAGFNGSAGVKVDDFKAWSLP